MMNEAIRGEELIYKQYVDLTKVQADYFTIQGRFGLEKRSEWIALTDCIELNYAREHVFNKVQLHKI